MRTGARVPRLTMPTCGSPNVSGGAGRAHRLTSLPGKAWESRMQFGGAMFFTDYSMSAAELARALEERGFESVWAPEHSHIPMSRKTPFPGGGDLNMMQSGLGECLD